MTATKAKHVSIYEVSGDDVHEVATWAQSGDTITEHEITSFRGERARERAMSLAVLLRFAESPSDGG